MITKTISLNVDYAAASDTTPQTPAVLRYYVLDPELLQKTTWSMRPAVVVCAGGGYRSRSVREAEPIALKFCAAGFHAFILDYSITPACWPVPTAELSAAVAHVRSVADENYIDKDKILVCGFSAGGHLAASLGVYWDDPNIQKLSYVSGEQNKPNGMILGYPVIIDDPDHTHIGTRDNFIGTNPENIKYFGLDKHITENTPKTFIWHSAEDASVPALSSLKLATALSLAGVGYELHIYPFGAHGMSLANRITAAEPKHLVPTATDWIEHAVTFINNL